MDFVLKCLCVYVYIYIYVYHGPPKPTFLEVFMVKWPIPSFVMVLGGAWYTMVYIQLYDI